MKLRYYVEIEIDQESLSEEMKTMYFERSVKELAEVFKSQYPSFTGVMYRVRDGQQLCKANEK